MSTQSSNRKGHLTPEMVDRMKRDVLLGVSSNPPEKSTRFQKGRSGNPKGRPRKLSTPQYESTQLHALTLLEGERRVSVRQGDKIAEISVSQALVQAQTVAALKGNPHAQRDALARHERARREEAAKIERQHAFWNNYREDRLRFLAEAKLNGEPEPRIFPHPLDIVIEPGKHVRIEGPINAEEAQQYESLVKIRDALIFQSALNRRCFRPGEQAAAGESRANGSDLLMLMIDALLPKRLRIDQFEWVHRTTHYELIAKRNLLKATFAAWRAAGLQVPRGKLFPDPEFAKRMARAFSKS